MGTRQRSQVTSPVLCCFPPAVPEPPTPHTPVSHCHGYRSLETATWRSSPPSFFFRNRSKGQMCPTPWLPHAHCDLTIIYLCLAFSSYYFLWHCTGLLYFILPEFHTFNFLLWIKKNSHEESLISRMHTLKLKNKSDTFIFWSLSNPIICGN